MQFYALPNDVGSPAPDVSEPFPRGQWFRALLLILVALSTYLSVPLLSGGRMLVPSFPTVALLPVVVVVAWRSISIADTAFVLKVFFILVASVALSPGLAYATQKILSLIQCCMGIVVAVLVVKLMQQTRTNVLENTLCTLWVLVIVGCVLELLGVITATSDAFRSWAYGETYTVYDAVNRDINMVGWLRPKLFSVEPSHVTKLFIAAVNAWLVVRVTWPKVWVTIAATLAMLIIMGSPMILASAAITFAIVLWNSRANLRTKIGMVLAAVVVAGIFGMYFANSRFSVIADRLTGIDEASISQGGQMGSEEKRLVYPYVVLIDTWSRWPVFGVGIGGKDVVFEHATATFNDADSAMGNNAFAEIGTYLGLVGSAWFLVVLSRRMRLTGIQRLGLTALVLVMFSQLMGGIITIRYWGYIALLWGALAVADGREQQGTQEPVASRA